MAKNDKKPPLAELLYQALETELGGVEIYRTALECVRNDDLRKEWTEYLEQTEEHVRVVTKLCVGMGLDPELDTPGRQVVRHIGKSLVKAMQLALGSAPPEAAEIVAAECIVLAETKDHFNWGLLGKAAKQLKGGQQSTLGQAALAKAYADVEDEEDEHLYHTTGWARELWFKSLGMKAELPPREETQDVESAIEAAKVQKARG